ncbi:MAG: hypothetical protein IKC22_04895 [Bacilli bacterium]|nr:hypothetical protein [Bacilli bacterium]
MKRELIPIILLICYVIGETYKLIFSKNRELFNLLPIILTAIGGILSIIMYVINNYNAFYIADFLQALQIGMISGASSTGVNQIIKKIILLQGGKNDIKK